VTVATWNIHRWIGADGRRDPARVRRVIQALGASIVALQEVTQPMRRVPATEYLERELGMTAIAGPTMRREGGDYGNLLLSRHPVLERRGRSLRVPPFEPRGAIDAVLLVGGFRLRVFATHLGLRRSERARQVDWLAEQILDGRDPVWVLLADLNEWLPWGRALRRLRRAFGRPLPRRTFPSRWPLLALDTVVVHPGARRASAAAVRVGEAAIASDHLPLRARVGIPTSGLGDRFGPDRVNGSAASRRPRSESTRSRREG
jgi:endonuclease/exonuclease/phosphatase family metal-dependent hydrolase